MAKEKRKAGDGNGLAAENSLKGKKPCVDAELAEVALDEATEQQEPEYITRSIERVKTLFRTLSSGLGGADGANGQGLTGYIRPTGLVKVLTALGVQGKALMDFGAHTGRSGPFFPEFRHVPRCSRAGSNNSAYTRRHGHHKECHR